MATGIGLDFLACRRNPQTAVTRSIKSCLSRNSFVVPDLCHPPEEMAIDDLSDEEGAAFLAAVES